jgi:hypothetical protein
MIRFISREGFCFAQQKVQIIPFGDFFNRAMIRAASPNLVSVNRSRLFISFPFETRDCVSQG